MLNFSREEKITQFLRANGWGDAVRDPMPGDASSRRYVRLEQGGKIAILMDAPISDDNRACPIGASNERRRELGYPAMARLAGSNPAAFVCIASALKRRGFAAPDIFATNLEDGLLLLEDLGDDLYAPVLDKTPALEKELYKKAVSCLAAIYRSSFSNNLTAHGASWHVASYDNMALQTEADLFLHWYIPNFDKTPDAKAQKQWAKIWSAALKNLNAHASGLALRDFHAENIFALGGKVGLIDFQDALFAHPSYDLVSLIEDARRDVDPNMAAPLITQFCQEAGITEGPDFHAAYAVQAAQRNAKILGIFVRLAQRDNKPHYLDFIPRVAAHFRRDLSHPALADLRSWMKNHAPSVLKEAP